MNLFVGFCMIVITAGAGIAPPPSLEILVNRLAGGGDAALVEARQLLPRHGVAAVPKILPMLAHEDAAIWRTTFSVLADIANEVSAPGREADREAVAASLMPLFTPEQPPHVKQRALRLLTIAAPEGVDLQPVAAILNGDDPDLREKARVALREMGTRSAVAALCGGLENADPAFQAALLHAIALMRDPQCALSVHQLTASSDPAVRAAAARALCWIGDPALIRPLESVWKAADESTRFDAGDALLRLADAIALQGNGWDFAVAVYRRMLREETHPVLRGGAIAGLGRFGDETVIEEILDAIGGDGGRELEPAAMEAFRQLQGPAVDRKLITAHSALSPDMQAGMLYVLAGAKNPVCMPLFQHAAQSDDPALRQAAIAALRSSGMPDALDTLAALARDAVGVESAAAAESAAAIAALRDMARCFAREGNAAAAGKAYLRLYQTAKDVEGRNEAMEGIRQFPVPEAFDVFTSEMSDEEVAALPVTTLLGVAQAMQREGRADDAERLFVSLMPRLNTTEAVREAAHLFNLAGGGPGAALRLGIIPRWRIAGPFPWSEGDAFTVNHVNEPAVDLSASYPVGDKAIGWQDLTTSDAGGTMDLMGLFGPIDGACAYAHTTIHLAEETDAVARAGSDDGIKVWVNGEAIIENNVDRGSDFDQDQGAARLRAGDNHILVCVTQGMGGWNFRLRLMRPDGSILPFTLAE